MVLPHEALCWGDDYLGTKKLFFKIGATNNLFLSFLFSLLFITLIHSDSFKRLAQTKTSWLRSKRLRRREAALARPTVSTSSIKHENYAVIRCSVDNQSSNNCENVFFSSYWSWLLWLLCFFFIYCLCICSTSEGVSQSLHQLIKNC